MHQPAQPATLASLGKLETQAISARSARAEEHAREVSDKKWKLCRGTSSTDDLAEGRLVS